MFRKDYFPGNTVAIFLTLLVFVELLVLNLQIGGIVVLAAAMILTAMLRPKWLFMVLIALFSIEGFAAVEDMSYPRIVGIILIAGLILRMALTRDSFPKDNAYTHFFLFFIGSFVSFWVAVRLMVSVKMYIVYISLFFLYLLARYFLRSMKDVMTALNVLFASTISAWVVVRILGLRVRSHGSLARISAGFADANEYAQYIMVLIPLALYMAMRNTGVKRIIYWGCLSGLLLLLVSTGSRGGVLGFLAAASILIYYYSIGKMRQLFFLVLFAAVILYFYAPENLWIRLQTIAHPETEQGSSIETRLINYKAALQMFLDYPLTGVGLYNFQFRSPAYGAFEGKVVHNTYLEVLTGGGLLSFLPFALLLINAWRKLQLKTYYDRNMRDFFICLKASFVSILVTSFFISADHKKILFFLLALISSAYYFLPERKGHHEANTK